MDQRYNDRSRYQTESSLRPAAIAGDAAAGERLSQLETENRLLREVVEGLLIQIVQLSLRK
jgi:hypothetical protein